MKIPFTGILNSGSDILFEFLSPVRVWIHVFLLKLQISNKTVHQTINELDFSSYPLLPQFRQFYPHGKDEGQAQRNE